MNANGTYADPAYGHPAPDPGYAHPAPDPGYGHPAAGPGYADPAYGAAPAQPARGPADGTAGGYYAPASAAASSDPNLDRDFDPHTGQRVDGFEDPANDPRLHDSRYDGRLAVDWVDPHEDDRVR
jgi:hypothetical protein